MSDRKKNKRCQPCLRSCDLDGFHAQGAGPRSLLGNLVSPSRPDPSPSSNPTPPGSSSVCLRLLSHLLSVCPRVRTVRRSLLGNSVSSCAAATMSHNLRAVSRARAHTSGRSARASPGALKRQRPAARGLRAARLIYSI